MALTPQERYAREVAKAKALGFATPYERRKARAIERGFTSPRAERTAREKAAGRKRDYALERERANIRARGRGFKNASEQRRYNAQAGTPEQKALAYFGVSRYMFDKMRRENRQWSVMNASNHANTYNLDKDKDVHNWDLSRVGYVVFYHRAMVNPKTNYWSVAKEYTRPDGKAGMRMNFSDAPKDALQAQFYYLTQYSGYMSVDEFESRYGGRAAAL